MPKSRRSRKSRRSTRRVRRGGWFAAAPKGAMPPMPPPMPVKPSMPVNVTAPKMAAPAPSMPKAMPAPSGAKPPMRGGKRTKRKASSWNKAVKRVYEEMKRKNRNATFGEAMRVASQRKKNGTL